MGVRFEDPPAVSATEQTYTALIQQYLGLFLNDNATFLAERMVATCPQSKEALHLLGVCYYRQGKPQRARAVLNDSPGKQSMYLLAKCHYELEEYGLAEEVLLRQSRAEFRNQDSSKKSHGSKDMNQYVVATSVSVVSLKI